MQIYATGQYTCRRRYFLSQAVWLVRGSEFLDGWNRGRGASWVCAEAKSEWLWRDTCHTKTMAACRARTKRSRTIRLIYSSSYVGGLTLYYCTAG
jgi:hypothetical protein